MASDLPRSPAARSIAEVALARFVSALGDHRRGIVIIGGLNPGLLADGSAPQHLGTIDVDVLLRVGLKFDRDEQEFAWLEQALAEAHFVEDVRTGGGWRWLGDVDGAAVKLELLCDVATDPRGLPIALPGCARVSAMNLEGPGAALIAAEPRVVHAGVTSVGTVAHAGLGGYLLSKAVAAARRATDDDYYDFVYVLLFNDHGGPTQAAHALQSDQLRDAYETHSWAVAEVCRNSSTPDSVGAVAYADRAVIAGDATDRAVLLQDAVTAVQQLAQALGIGLN